MSHHAVRTTVAVAALSLAALGPPVQAQDKTSAQELADLRARIAEQGLVDLRARAQAGEAGAQFALGTMYSTEEDDAETGAAWYRKAAEQGHALAQSNLGEMHHDGRGVPQDYGEAVAWFHLAAEQGDARGQENPWVDVRPWSRRVAG